MKSEGTKALRKKVVATAGGAAWDLWLGQLLVYAFEKAAGNDLPVRIEDAAVGLIGVGIGAFVGWFVCAEPGE